MGQNIHKSAKKEMILFFIFILKRNRGFNLIVLILWNDSIYFLELLGWNRRPLHFRYLHVIRVVLFKLIVPFN